MAAKNLGQVAGLFIGTIAPTNHALIWYDIVTHVHKTYDTSINSWTVLDPRYITAITYNGLVSRAAGDGLTQGQWYKIIDKGNVLAIAITATKVQYVNNNGVLVIDDLGTHIIYTVTSENLIIDDITGVYDANTNKLVFSFSETTPDFNTGDIDVDYVLGEQKRGTSKTLKKFRISSFLSTVTGNDITWNGGFFFNFYNKLITYFDVNGGIVSKTAFEQFKTLNSQAIENIAGTVADATTDAQIYSKHLPETPTPAVAADIIVNDTLQTIVFKIQRWIWQLKAGDGIQVTSTGMVEPEEGNIYPTDTIFTAIKKLLYKITHIGTDSILDDAVTTAKLATDAVTTDKILNSAVTTNKIANSAVTTDKIGNQAVKVLKLDSDFWPILIEATGTNLNNETKLIDTLLEINENGYWVAKTYNCSGAVKLIRSHVSGIDYPAKFSIIFTMSANSTISIGNDIVIPSSSDFRYVKMTFQLRTSNVWHIEWIDPFTDFYTGL